MVWIKKARKREKEQKGWTKSLETIVDKMSDKDTGLQSLIETLEKN